MRRPQSPYQRRGFWPLVDRFQGPTVDLRDLPGAGRTEMQVCDMLTSPDLLGLDEVGVAIGNDR